MEEGPFGQHCARKQNRYKNVKDDVFSKEFLTRKTTNQRALVTVTPGHLGEESPESPEQLLRLMLCFTSLINGLVPHSPTKKQSVGSLIRYKNWRSFFTLSRVLINCCALSLVSVDNVRQLSLCSGSVLLSSLSSLTKVWGRSAAHLQDGNQYSKCWNDVAEEYSTALKLLTVYSEVKKSNYGAGKKSSI